MKALYKLAFVVLLAVLAIFLQPLAFGGGLDRIMATGPTAVGNGSDPNGPWIPENLASRIQIRGEFLEFGAEVMVPKFVIKDRLGRELVSKGVTHELPYFNYGWQESEDRVVGVVIDTEFGTGGSFEKSFGTMDSRTLICGNYIKPYVAQRLSDEWSIGLGINLVNTMMTWNGPLDINRHYLPISTDTRAIGYGVGYEAGLFYQPTDNLAFGLDYMSKVDTSLTGRTEVLRPFHLRDEVRTHFEFPDRLTLSAAWKINPRWLAVANWKYFGYSNNSLDQAKIKFDRFMITKGVKTNWTDNYAVEFGMSYLLTERWTIGGGIGYMSKAVPDKTCDFMTPDVGGFAVAGRAKYKVSDCFDVTAGLSYGWGSNKADGREIKAQCLTGALSATWKF